ncbi:MAG: FixH family protein [Planctomycetota bacterium]|jgi:hypothetical protein
MIMRPDHRLDIHAAMRRAGPSVACLAGVLAAWTLLVGCGGEDATTVPVSEEAVADGASVAGPAGESAGEAEPAEAPSGEMLQGEAVTAGGGYLVRWRSGPAGVPALEPFSLEVEVEQSAGVPLAEGATVLVDAAMPHHGHGMNFVPEVTRTGPGRYAVEGMLFHMRGRWELFVDVERDGVLERAQWTVVLE